MASREASLAEAISRAREIGGEVGASKKKPKKEYKEALAQQADTETSRGNLPRGRLFG